MKHSFALIAACLALAGNAHAVDGYLFGDSNNSAVDNKLTINGSIETLVIDAGWYGDTGLHVVDPRPGYADYLVGICSACAVEGEPGAYNDWFIVDLTEFTSAPTVTWLTLTLSPFNVTTAGTFKLWDYLGDIDVLPLDTPPGAAGIAIYDDLGSGKLYGSFAYLGTESPGSYQTITLSSDAILDLNVAISNARNGGETRWAIGGSFAPTAPIPEPETYALMLAGLGLVGWMAKRRKA
jgi:hypothetical protein